MQEKKANQTLLQIYRKQQVNCLSPKLVSQELGLQMAKSTCLNSTQQTLLEKRIRDNEANIEKLNQRLDELTFKIKEIEAIIEGRAKILQLSKSKPANMRLVSPHLVCLKLIPLNTSGANSENPQYHLPPNNNSEIQ